MSATATPEALLASVTRTREMLGGISLSTLDRLVDRGVLQPVKLTPKPTADSGSRTSWRSSPQRRTEMQTYYEDPTCPLKTVDYEVPVAPEDALRFEQAADDERYALLDGHVARGAIKREECRAGRLA